MADISSVNPSEIKEISDSLEALSCKYIKIHILKGKLTTDSPDFDTFSLLTLGHLGIIGRL
jgi:hypothetical protein